MFYFGICIETFGNKRNLEKDCEMLTIIFSETLVAKVKNQKINKKVDRAIRNGEDIIMQIRYLQK